MILDFKRQVRSKRTGEPSRFERGQAVVETALVAIILVLLLTIILDLGRAFFTYVALQNAAGEGAYFGSAFPNQKGTNDTNDPNTIIGRAKNESPRTAQLVNWDNATVEIRYPDTAPQATPTSGESIQVNIKYPYEFIGPVPGIFGVYRFTMDAEAHQRIVASSDAALADERPQTEPQNGPGPNK